MKFFILVMIVSAALSQFQMLAKLAPFSKSLQKICVDHSPQFSVHIESLNALVCGSSVKNSLIKELFINTELYHLLIVSGSHLQTLLWVFRNSTNRTFSILTLLKWALLIAYSLITGLGAPILRALVAESLRSTSFVFRWHWSSWKVQTVSGFLLLAMNPEYFSSLSFFLSWLASLGFLIPFPKNQSGILKHFLLCFAISMLMLVPFSYQGPLGFLMNFLLGGFLSLLLFPLAIIIKIIFISGADLHFVFDFIFSGLLWGLEKSQSWGLSEFREKTFPHIDGWLWIRLLGIQLGLFSLRSYSQRIRQ